MCVLKSRESTGVVSTDIHVFPCFETKSGTLLPSTTCWGVIFSYIWQQWQIVQTISLSFFEVWDWTILWSEFGTSPRHLSSNNAVVSKKQSPTGLGNATRPSLEDTCLCNCWKWEHSPFVSLRCMEASWTLFTVDKLSKCFPWGKPKCFNTCWTGNTATIGANRCISLHLFQNPSPTLNLRMASPSEIFLLLVSEEVRLNEKALRLLDLACTD